MSAAAMAGRRSGLLMRIYLWLFFAYLFGPLAIMSLATFNDSRFPTITPWLGTTVKWFPALFADAVVTLGRDHIEVVHQFAQDVDGHTGVGMAFELMHDLSGPASADDVETMATGTGTGLTLSRRLAEAMGGMLLFESRPGRGTTVRLWLPAAAQASR